MKIVSNKISVLIAFLLGVVFDMAAAPPPPKPTAMSDPSLAGPPGWPIDENIFFLLIVALLLGIYVIYKNKLKTKAPI
ncbi:hypothetical protein [Flavobacterium maritimum]|uniref:hypothetical protein n=1 Tax=Flavobacterium maritimum TaxID=3149042 RepID=UPI0032B32FA8